MKDFFSILTERRIQEAIARGDSKNLPGAGKPLKLEYLYFLPKKLRSAYIVLKNSGYLEIDTSVKTCNLTSSSDNDLNAPEIITTMTRQELCDNLLKYNIMMDCKRRG